MNESHDWLLTLGFAINVPASQADEFTVGSVWGPGIVEAMRFARGAADIGVRAYVLPGRVPLREAVGSEGEILAAKLTPWVADVALRARADSLYTVTGEETHIPLGVVVPWESWSIMIRLDNPAGVGRDVYGHFVIRVLGHPVLPLPAFWERGVARHLQFSELRGVS